MINRQSILLKDRETSYSKKLQSSFFDYFKLCFGRLSQTETRKDKNSFQSESNHSESEKRLLPSQFNPRHNKLQQSHQRLLKESVITELEQRHHFLHRL